MNAIPEDIAFDDGLLDLEWARIARLITLAEALRTGAALDDTFSESFSQITEAVSGAREQGVWAGLREAVPAERLGDLLQLDLDLLALALAPDARPATGAGDLAGKPLRHGRL